MTSEEDKKMNEIINSITNEMNKIIDDTSVPKNVRGAISEAKAKLNASGEYVVRIADAIYSVDAVSNDINLPPQARTSIWHLLSKLESIKEEVNEQ
ncbi:MAG: UPF0147 family protein [Candidatus Marsarchaeota archaeon]|nr:UPF0147 family protein [Candidatus Marsarchaeota archaeon]